MTLSAKHDVDIKEVAETFHDFREVPIHHRIVRSVIRVVLKLSNSGYLAHLLAQYARARLFRSRRSMCCRRMVVVLHRPLCVVLQWWMILMRIVLGKVFGSLCEACRRRPPRRSRIVQRRSIYLMGVSISPSNPRSQYATYSDVCAHNLSKASRCLLISSGSTWGRLLWSG